MDQKYLVQYAPTFAESAVDSAVSEIEQLCELLEDLAALSGYIHGCEPSDTSH